MSLDTNKAMARASLTHVIGEGKLDRLDDSVAYEPGTQCGIKMISWLREVFPDLCTEGAVPWMGCRPAFPDSLPIIGRSPKFASVYFSFGHGHHGLGAGGRTGRLIADLVAERRPAIDLNPFRTGRF